MLAYFVAQQRRELGIRLALGAGAYGTLQLILRRVVRIVLLGLGAGAGLYLTASKYLTSILYGVNHFDAPAVTATLILVSAVCLLAAAVPCLRAIRLNPATILRED